MLRQHAPLRRTRTSPRPVAMVLPAPNPLPLLRLVHPPLAVSPEVWDTEPHALSECLFLEGTAPQELLETPLASGLRHGRAGSG